MDNNIEDKVKNLEEWHKERERVKPVIDKAVNCHNKAWDQARKKNYKQAANFYREAIKNYKQALSLNPKYYLQDLLDRVDHVVEEHVNNTFNLKSSDETLKTEAGIVDFIKFVDNLSVEEKRYVNPYDIAMAFFRIGDLYHEDGRIEDAYRLYSRVVEINCDRPFINHDAYLKIARILFEQTRFKESLMNFIYVFSFDRGNREIIGSIERCLRKLGISEYRDKFLVATPYEARKLIMEVL